MISSFAQLSFILLCFTATIYRITFSSSTDSMKAQDYDSYEMHYLLSHTFLYERPTSSFSPSPKPICHINPNPNAKPMPNPNPIPNPNPNPNPMPNPNPNPNPIPNPNPDHNPIPIPNPDNKANPYHNSNASPNPNAIFKQKSSDISELWVVS